MYASWLGECLPPPASKYVSARLLTHSESPTHSLACLPAAELAAHGDALGDGGDARVVEREPLRPADGAHVRLKDTWG